MIRYNTSLRVRPIAETLTIAKEYAPRFGITRVTNTTRLDNIGIPVFVSIRPDAQVGSLCVSSGKGLREEEAKVGAYMEGLELAMIEPHRRLIPTFEATVKDVLDGQDRLEAILDFCPKIGVTFEPDQVLPCVEAIDLISGQTLSIPAELVFLPYRFGKRNFGSSTNGVSSGNSLEEASLHGILEVIERDIMSFQIVRGDSVVIHPDSYPDNVREIHDRVQSAGHELNLRYGKNQFDFPFIIATLLDGERKDPIFVNGGYGCHFYTQIAMMRAASEAVQSRLAYIHGGRDDLIEGYNLYKDWSYQQRAEKYQRISNNVSQMEGAIRFEEIPELSHSFSTVGEYLQYSINFLKDLGFSHILRVAYTQPDEPIQVVKILIPRMEFFTLKSTNVGHRLKAFVDGFWKA